MRGLRFASLTALACSTLLLGVPAGCGSAFTAESSGDSGTDGPTATDGTAYDGGPDSVAPGDGPLTHDGSGGPPGSDGAGSSDGSGGFDGPLGNIVYVSMSGHDSSTGFDPKNPKQTIVSALTEAQTLPAGAEVHVCAGSYAEAGLSITFDVRLLGGYDCTTWTRPADYGFPTFDVSVTTTITSANGGGPQLSTVEVKSDSNATVDGFVVVGATTTSVRSIGFHATDTSSPKISNDVLQGGAGHAGGAMATGSTALLVDVQAAPSMITCLVQGGTGNGTTGSTGVVLGTMGAVVLENDIITGGAGSASGGTISAVGIDVASMAPTSAIKGVFVLGTDEAALDGNSIGVRVAGSGTSATIESSVVSGGLGSANNGASYGVWIDTTASGNVTLVDDRIYGGGQGGTPSSTYGVFVAAANMLTVESCLIHGGSSPEAIGIDVDDTASPVLEDDTVYTGDTGGTAIVLNSGVTNATITDDLLIGGSDASDVGVSAQAEVPSVSCNTLVRSLNNTAFANLTTLFQCVIGAQVPVELTNQDLYSGPDHPNASADVFLTTSCTGTSGVMCGEVPGCPGPVASCLGALFGPSFSSFDDGVCSILGTCAAEAGVPEDAWTLDIGSTCVLTNGGVPIPGITTDIYGTPRPTSPPPTIGAVQFTGTCM
jgi:hypothetical protein